VQLLVLAASRTGRQRAMGVAVRRRVLGAPALASLDTKASRELALRPLLALQSAERVATRGQLLRRLDTLQVVRVATSLATGLVVAGAEDIMAAEAAVR
jgi:hypothetical protein